MQGYPPLVSPLCMLVCFNPHSSSRLNAKEPEIKRATLPFRRRERDSNPRGFHPTVFKTVAIDHSAIPPTKLYHILNPFEKGMAEKSHVTVKMEPQTRIVDTPGKGQLYSLLLFHIDIRRILAMNCHEMPLAPLQSHLYTLVI